MRLTLVGSTDRQLEELLRDGRAHVTSVPEEGLASLAASTASLPDVIVLDLRDRGHVPPALAQIRRQHPATGVVIVASKLDPGLMLEAMRAGVNELVADPVTRADLRAAIDRVMEARPTAAAPGQVFAFIGAKGGVGTTTVAVNVATALAKVHPGGTLLIDLHQAYGDAALFLGAEPRFSIVDALENTHRLDEAFFRGLVLRTKAGPELLASSERATVPAADVQRVRALIEFAARHYRYTILDVPRSDSAMLDALEHATTITIVANQDLATVRAGSRMAATLRQRYGKDRVNVVISRYDAQSEIGQSDMERVLGASIRQLFPSNYRLAVEALNTGRPLVVENHNKLASSLIGFARGLAGVATEKKSEPSKSGGLFGLLSRRPQQT
jgi:pilus assembly protein CpaE